MEPPIKTGRKKKEKLVMMTKYLSYDVIKDVAENEYNFKLTESDKEEFDLIWYDLWVNASLLK